MRGRACLCAVFPICDFHSSHRPPFHLARQMVDFNIAGVISIIVFYILILLVGIWAGKKKPPGEDDSEDVMLAGRSIGVFVGIFTMTGEWCCSGTRCRCCFLCGSSQYELWLRISSCVFVGFMEVK